MLPDLGNRSIWMEPDLHLFRAATVEACCEDVAVTVCQGRTDGAMIEHDVTVDQQHVIPTRKEMILRKMDRIGCVGLFVDGVLDPDGAYRWMSLRDKVTKLFLVKAGDEDNVMDVVRLESVQHPAQDWSFPHRE